MSKRVELVCQVCGNPFTYEHNKGPLRKYCSRGCAAKAVGRRTVGCETEGLCKQCGCTFSYIFMGGNRGYCDRCESGVPYLKHRSKVRRAEAERRRASAIRRQGRAKDKVIGPKQLTGCSLGRFIAQVNDVLAGRARYIKE